MPSSLDPTRISKRKLYFAHNLLCCQDVLLFYQTVTYLTAVVREGEEELDGNMVETSVLKLAEGLKPKMKVDTEWKMG